MESVADVLGRYSPQGPDEVLAIKQYIEHEFNTGAGVALRGDTLVVTVGSASLANTLRLRISALREATGVKKRIMFRIG